MYYGKNKYKLKILIIHKNLIKINPNLFLLSMLDNC